MRRAFIELIAVCAAAAFALMAIRMATPDENIAFFIALVGSIAVGEGVRFLMFRYSQKQES